MRERDANVMVMLGIAVFAAVVGVVYLAQQLRLNRRAARACAPYAVVDRTDRYAICSVDNGFVVLKELP